MAKKVASEKGQDRLSEAMAMLVQNMAILTQNQGIFLGQIAEIERSTAERFARIDERLARIDERFARMEQDMTAIMRVLAEHGRMMERLPEAVRDKIGFKGPPTQCLVSRQLMNAVGWDKLASASAGPPMPHGGPALASSLVPPYTMRSSHE